MAKISRTFDENGFPRFGMRDKLAYAAGDFGCNMSFALASYLAVFYTQYIGLSASLFALLLIILKVWDAVNDPLIGALMDGSKKTHKRGKFKSYIFVGSFGLVVAAALCFIPIPNAALWLKIAVCMLGYMAWDLFYTVVNVPYGSMVSVITAEPGERAQLSAWRNVGALVAGMGIGVVLPMIIYDENDNLMGGMMFPIALSVIMVMKEQKQSEKGMANFSLVLMLVIAYASNIGGIATVIGTPPNVAFVAYIEKKYDYAIPFLDWMILCTPLAIVLLACLYFILTKWLYPNRIKSSIETNLMIRNEVESLGKLTTAEKRVLVIFICTALLWITKDLINKAGFIKLDDNMIAVMGALALFAMPSGTKQDKKMKMILEWEDTSKMAWGILLLFGGGIALASALEKAGVMELIGNWLAGFSQSGGFILVLLIVFISIFLSEMMSNVAQVIVLAPVMAALADALHLDPLLLGIPMTLAASAASMMPMGTPPNAIVFGSGYIQLKDMMKAGFVINIVSIIVITLFSWFVLPLIMNVVR